MKFNHPIIQLALLHGDSAVGVARQSWSRECMLSMRFQPTTGGSVVFEALNFSSESGSGQQIIKELSQSTTNAFFVNDSSLNMLSGADLFADDWCVRSINRRTYANVLQQHGMFFRSSDKMFMIVELNRGNAAFGFIRKHLKIATIDNVPPTEGIGVGEFLGMPSSNLLMRTEYDVASEGFQMTVEYIVGTSGDDESSVVSTVPLVDHIFTENRSWLTESVGHLSFHDIGDDVLSSEAIVLPVR